MRGHREIHNTPYGKQKRHLVIIEPSGVWRIACKLDEKNGYETTIPIKTIKPTYGILVAQRLKDVTCLGCREEK